MLPRVAAKKMRQPWATTDVSRPSIRSPTLRDASPDVAPSMRLPFRVAARRTQPGPVRPARPEYPNGLAPNHAALCNKVVSRTGAQLFAQRCG